MSISLKEKELAAVGISIAAGCRPCTDYHIDTVRKAGASDDEIRQVVSDAIAVRRAATDIMERHALRQPSDNGDQGEADASRTSRVSELVSLGAAFAVNSTPILERHLAGAAAAGVSEEEVGAVAEIAAFIKKVAASQVEKLVGNDEQGGVARPAKKSAGGCCA